MESLLGLMLCLSCDATATTALPVQAGPVDVELVLAVDTSRSMDPEEFALQRAGYVAALRHPDFLHAIRTGVNGRIAITYFEWAGTVREESVVGWQLIDSGESADAFADSIEARPIDTFRGTSISGALRFGASLFDDNEFDGYRRVIDISGDGPNNIGMPVVPERDAAVSAGIVVNGLPILVRPSQTFQDLDRYYAECVTGGPGSFVLPIRHASEFATAIRRKLILEVSGLADNRLVIPVQAQALVDCERGERDRRLFSDPYFPQLGP
jgi:hypothetical protein